MAACDRCGYEHPADAPCPQRTVARTTTLDSGNEITVGAGGMPAAGSRLGAYRLVEILGEGGMGFVYLAEHIKLGRRVALKLLRPEYADNPRAVSRFFGEARSVNKISHENIVEITDFIEADSPGDPQYYIMELLRGISLQDLLQDEGALPAARIVRIAGQVCNALCAVHDANIIHRDLKPDNIFLITRDGRPDVVKLLDFGVAKLSDLPEAGTSVSQTTAGTIIGTPEYMSPEQAAGKPVDHRTDIYALGVILFEMATGGRPFTGKSFGEMVIKHMTVAPPRPSKLKELKQPVPKVLEDLILHCLAKKPEDRPQSMANIAQRLTDSALQLGTVSGEFAIPANPHHKWIVGAAVAAVVMAGIGVLAFSGSEPASSAVVQAPAAEVVAAVAAQAPAPVEIVFSSTPSGATVRREGEPASLGTTPFTLSVEQAEVTDTYEISLPGHVTQLTTASRSNNAEVAVVLAAQKTTAKKPRVHTNSLPKASSRSNPSNPSVAKPLKPRAIDKSAVLDPFAED